MRRLVLVTLIVLFLLPIMTPAIAPAFDLGTTAVAAGVDGDDDRSFFDWLVIWWTTHLDQWPD